MALLKRLFPYRSCTKKITGDDPRPCLEYHIKRCVAPCVGYASHGEYREVIDQVMLFLEGKHDDVLRALNRQMHDAAEGLKFERAASLRDQLRAIEKVSQEQKAVTVGAKDQDVIAVAQSDDEAWVEVFFIREGKLTGRDHFILAGARGESPATIVGEFANQYYPTAAHVPGEVLVEHDPPEREALIEALESRRGRRVRLHKPLRGDKRRLVELVASNAREGLDRRRARWLADTEKVSAALDELEEALSLPAPPRRIETYDISNIQGSNAVGSMAVFEDGRPSPSRYRRFKIKTVEGSDDYAMMREMLRRRFSRAGKRRAASNGGEEAEAAPDPKGWGRHARARPHRRGAGAPQCRLGGPAGVGARRCAPREHRQERGAGAHPRDGGARRAAPQLPGALSRPAHARRGPPLRHHLPPQPALEEKRPLGDGRRARNRPPPEEGPPSALRFRPGSPATPRWRRSPPSPA